MFVISQMAYSHRIESSKTVWVTDTCIMPNVNMIAVTTTARAVSFYDITGNRFVEVVVFCYGSIKFVVAIHTKLL